MFDARLRPLIDPALNRMGAALARAGITANQVTVAGALCGALAGVAIGLGSIISFLSGYADAAVQGNLLTEIGDNLVQEDGGLILLE